MLSFYQQINLGAATRRPITTITNSLPFVNGSRPLIAADDMYVTYYTEGKIVKDKLLQHFIHIGFNSKFEIME